MLLVPLGDSIPRVPHARAMRPLPGCLNSPEPRRRSLNPSRSCVSPALVSPWSPCQPSLGDSPAPEDRRCLTNLPLKKELKEKQPHESPQTSQTQPCRPTKRGCFSHLPLPGQSIPKLPPVPICRGVRLFLLLPPRSAHEPPRRERDGVADQPRAHAHSEPAGGFARPLSAGWGRSVWVQC